MYNSDESKNTHENNSSQGEGVFIRYNPYKKQFNYYYSENGRIDCPLGDNVVAELNPYTWNQVENIIDILIKKYGVHNNAGLTVYFQGCEDDFKKLEEVCNFKGCVSVYDKSKTLESASILLQDLFTTLKEIKNNIQLKEIEKYLNNQIENEYSNDDKANACMVLINALHYVSEELKKYSPQIHNTGDIPELTLEKGSWHLIKSKEHKWQDLKDKRGIKFYDTKVLQTDITESIIHGIKNDTFNYFAKRLSDGSSETKITSRIDNLPSTLPGNINTNNLMKVYFKEFDDTLSASIKDSICNRLDIILRNSGTLKKWKQADEMNQLMQTTKKNYFDDLADVFMNCVKKELGCSMSTAEDLMYESKSKECSDIYEKFRKKIEFA